MAKCIISEGKTTTEAIEKGLKEIGLPKELVEIKVLEKTIRNIKSGRGGALSRKLVNEEVM